MSGCSWAARATSRRVARRVRSSLVRTSGSRRAGAAANSSRKGATSGVSSSCMASCLNSSTAWIETESLPAMSCKGPNISRTRAGQARLPDRRVPASNAVVPMEMLWPLYCGQRPHERGEYSWTTSSKSLRSHTPSTRSPPWARH
ncbi:hypothetical protein [Lentzea roselyniae]|uniref:hypothetical protein n=1 Tax=Lentzea roselyniae TaxID=531940 RepID=UPI0031F812AE